MNGSDPQTTAEQDHWTDETSMAVCAIRYTIGRRSYIVADGWKWALRYALVSRPLRRTLIRDLEEKFEQAARSTSEYHPLGFDSDVAGWRDVLEKLKAMEAASAST